MSTKPRASDDEKYWQTQKFSGSPLIWTFRFADRNRFRELYKLLSKSPIRVRDEVGKYRNEGWRLPSRSELERAWRQFGDDQRAKLDGRVIYTNGPTVYLRPECIRVKNGELERTPCQVIKYMSARLVLVKRR